MKAKWFTKVDVVQAFYKVCVKEGYKWKTAFRTRYGLFEWLVMPFGLSGVPATFQRYINFILCDLFDECCLVYMDDILIYIDGTRKQYMEKVWEVLECIVWYGLHLDLDKFEFAQKKVWYLGFIIVAGVGIMPDLEKIKAILEWEPSMSIKGV